MSDYIFLFDLDSTITRQEILPTVAKTIGCLDEMRNLTEATMQGEIPFRTSFLKRVNLLSRIEVSKVREIVKNIPLNESIADFIRDNQERCYIVTGNLDVWICDLMDKLGMSNHVYCSRADVSNNMITKVVSVADKEMIAKQFVQPIVAIGDGDNDSGMAKIADIAIGFGGVRSIAPALLRCIDYGFYDEMRCSNFLRDLL